MNAAHFRDLLAEHFNLDELRLLCRDLGIEYENLSGDTRQLKAQALVEYCQRHGRLSSLTARCRELRQAVYWPELGLGAAERGENSRPGTGYIIRNGIKIPDIEWGGEVPAGNYTISAENSKSFVAVSIIHPYRLARYPITVAQFACFVDAADVDNKRWWVGMPEDKKYKAQLAKPTWPAGDRLREMVTWYQAIAFCRWLDFHLRVADLIRAHEEVDLPHEDEWEVAARYAGNGQCDRRIYPWGNTITVDHANYFGTGLWETSAVGLFPAGRQPVLGLYDLSGNVWEWCRNKYDRPQETVVDASNDPRPVRGGSWSFNRVNLRAACRDRLHPDLRDDSCGFRVVVRRRTPSHEH